MGNVSKSLEIQQEDLSQGNEQQKQFNLDRQKTEEQIDQELQKKDTEQQIETGSYAETFDTEVEELQKKVEQGLVSKEESKKLYNEITKKYDQTFLDKAKTVTENIADGMGIRDKVNDKRNIKNTLLWAGGVAAVGWVASKWKSWFKKKKKTGTENPTETTTESKGNTVINVDAKEKNSWWRRNWGWLVGGGAAVGAGWYFKDKLYKIPLIGGWLDGLFNDRLSFDEALNSVAGNINKHAKENNLKGSDVHLVGDNKLSAFGFEHEIDIKKKTIKGLNIKFANYEELIATVVIIGSAQYYFRGKAKSNDAFSIDNGNIYFDQSNLAVSGTNPNLPWTKVGAITGVTLGGIAGAYLKMPLTALLSTVGGAGVGGAALGNMADNNNTMGDLIPILNKGKNQERLQGYLNSLGGWKAGNDEKLVDKAKTNNEKINKIFVDTFEKIEGNVNEYDKKNHKQGGERDAYIHNYAENNNIFEMRTWGKNSYLHADIDSQGNILSVELEDIGIKFTGSNAVEEVIRLGSFISKCEKELAGCSPRAQAFEYTSLLRKTGFQKGIYFYQNQTINMSRLKLTQDAIKNYYPTLLKDKNMDQFITWMNTRESGGQSLWTDTEDKNRDNTYLKKLEKQANEGPYEENNGEAAA